ncbi:glutathione ABC transporter ATP-binding protein [Streptomyces olivaceoviridis]|uniref:dipeptide ABC transporter ATP-binding protein n=1 Tax=Streptomyces olivaceoviridis TaxID=1921 RepID=UPI00167BBD16|nr:ABC transporter ATP-binding protein [Streptomyces olivaceoviridis]GGZ25527.1 glutathione ABC transporter ATP-binding protein [Streptomyces olivaceoviridis]
MTATTKGPAARTAASGPILELDDLGVVFTTETGEVPAVKGVCLQVRPGETLALVGESGSGKSTIALAAMGLLAANARATGSAVIAGTQIVGAPESGLAALRGKTVSMVFQEPATALDPLTRIGKQIAEVIRNHREVSAKDAAAEAVELLRRVGIPEPGKRARAYPFQLSGGQRQRVVIAMAIANEPGLLIADEPTTALDVTVQAEILDLLRRLAAETGTGVLLVTHNMGVVADFADRVAVMYRGEIVETGPVEDVLLRPAHDYTRRLLAAVPRLSVAAVADGTGRPPATARARTGGPAAGPSTPPPGSGAPGDRTPDRPAGGSAAGSAAGPVANRVAEPVVKLRDVSVVFGRGKAAVRALGGVSFRVEPAQTLGLVGESGSGKSTAARVALGLIPPTSGTVSLFGADLARTRARARRALRAGIGVVLQDPVASLDARMTVGECVAEPLRIHRRDLSAKDRQAKVAAVLDRVRLPREVARRAPRELSGGQRQRVSLARALVLEPRLLVADEPTSALDVSVQEAVLEVITELQGDLGFACLFVSHDLAVVQHFAQRVVVMRAGRIEEQGPTGTTLLHPETDYTRRLLAAVPVPDPVVQRGRRAERLATLAAGRTEAQA